MANEATLRELYSRFGALVSVRLRGDDEVRVLLPVLLLPVLPRGIIRVAESCCSANIDILIP